MESIRYNNPKENIDRSRGAIDAELNVYVKPSKASKSRTYKCFDCEDVVILKQGEVNRRHFCHYPVSNCGVY